MKFFAANVFACAAIFALAVSAVGQEFPLEMVKLEPVVRVAGVPEPIPLPPVAGAEQKSILAGYSMRSRHSIRSRRCLSRGTRVSHRVLNSLIRR